MHIIVSKSTSLHSQTSYSTAAKFYLHKGSLVPFFLGRFRTVQAEAGEGSKKKKKESKNHHDDTTTTVAATATKKATIIEFTTKSS
jgi:hypothetical protein